MSQSGTDVTDLRHCPCVVLTVKLNDSLYPTNGVNHAMLTYL